MSKNRVCATATGLPKINRRAVLAALPAAPLVALPVASLAQASDESPSEIEIYMQGFREGQHRMLKLIETEAEKMKADTKGAADLFPLWLAEVDYINGPATDSFSDEELDAACWPMDALETKIMTAPNFTAQDMAVKLVVSTGFGSHDDNTAICQAASLLGQSHRVPECVRCDF